eukprot:NODE_124_length_17341_cov_0.560028.p14 type:complete len:105 gc:universal NODE_124_length_17341_cov_0.560028:378-692(+)
MSDAQDLQQLQHIAENQLEAYEDSMASSSDDSFEGEELQNELDLLETDPERPEILPRKTRGKKIDFKLAEAQMQEEIKAFNEKNGVDPMEVEIEDEEYTEPIEE